MEDSQEYYQSLFHLITKDVPREEFKAIEAQYLRLLSFVDQEPKCLELSAYFKTHSLRLMAWWSVIPKIEVVS